VSLRIRFRFDGRCRVHPRYNPEKDGRPQHKECSGCETLWVIHLYSAIARRKADAGEGIVVFGPASHASAEEAALEPQDDLIDNHEPPETEHSDVSSTS